MKTTKKVFVLFTILQLVILVADYRNAFAQSETISTSLCGQAPAGNPCPGATNVRLYQFAYNITSGDPAFTAINGFTTSGTYTAADITGFTIYVTQFCAFNTSTPLQTIAASGPGPHTFTFADPLPAAASQRYFWITTNIAGGAVAGHTIKIDLITAAMTAVTGTETYGTNVAGGTQTICNVLPVELVSFSGERNGEINTLDWATATEINTHYFSVEKSEDGNNFEEFQQVLAAGNSSQILNYHTIDVTPYNNMYYRLKLVDLNGMHGYSEIIQVTTSQSNEFEIYPNPATSFFQLQNSLHNPLRLKMLNSLGSVVFETTVTAEKTDISTLPDGMYFIYLYVGEEILVKKLLKKTE
jgi:hypothetical protein